MKQHTKPKKIIIPDGGEVTIEWGASLGRLVEGYGRGGDHVKGKIRISKHLLPRTERFTLFHELCHELWVKAGLREKFSLKTEEYVLEDWLIWLWETLNVNPEAREFIFDE